MRFTSKAYLVTGGARGIGHAIAMRLAGEGARVTVLDTVAAPASDSSDHIRTIRGDVSREPAVKRAIAATLRWAGRLDGVIANAGIADPTLGAIERVTLARWRRYLDVNLTGQFLCAKHAAAALRKTRGAIVNIASTRAHQSEPNTFAYSASKGGSVALTHSLAVSLGPEIRVNCITPGWIATGDRTKLSRADHAQHPVGRVGTPDDIAGLCAWLLSDEAGFVTGAEFISDGGMTRKMIRLAERLRRHHSLPLPRPLMPAACATRFGLLASPILTQLGDLVFVDTRFLRASSPF